MDRTKMSFVFQLLVSCTLTLKAVVLIMEMAMIIETTLILRKRLLYNMSHADCAGSLFYSIMKSTYDAPRSSQDTAILYDHEITSEDGMLTWAMEKEGAEESDKIFVD